jgi:hypothetical protein
MSPYEMRHGEAADLDRLKVFGCTAYVARDKKETNFVKDQKFDTRGAEICLLKLLEFRKIDEIAPKCKNAW